MYIIQCRVTTTCTCVSPFSSDNLGSSILYLWIERIREFLEELQEASPDVGKCFGLDCDALLGCAESGV